MKNEVILKFLKRELETHRMFLGIVSGDKDFEEGVEVLKELIKDYEKKEQNYE